MDVDDDDEMDVDDSDDINVASHSDRASALIQQCEPTFAELAKNKSLSTVAKKNCKNKSLSTILFFGN